MLFSYKINLHCFVDSYETELAPYADNYHCIFRHLRFTSYVTIFGTPRNDF